MDVINPGIIVLGKRYYRNNFIVPRTQVVAEDDKSPLANNFDEHPCDYEELKCDFPIFQDGNEFVCHLPIASMFYGFIIGKNSENKKRIELDTQTSIIMPKRGNNDKIIVRGKFNANVDKAVCRIVESAELARKKSPFTHFFSVPANNESIVKSFNLFRSEVLRQCIGDHGLEERLFQKSYKLHLTLSVVVLGDHSELENMVKSFKRFQSINEEIFHQPLRVHIKGLEYMNDDPCEVRVLYGKVDRHSFDGEKLQMLADRLSDFLFDNRLTSKKENGSVVLHMTLLNASFVSERDLALDTTSDDKSQKCFDCSNILKRFSDWDFGVLQVGEICLSKRHGLVQDEYYPSAATFKFG